MGCELSKPRRIVSWSCPSPGILRFNVDKIEESRGLLVLEWSFGMRRGDIMYVFLECRGLEAPTKLVC